MPTRALWELEHDPEQMVLTIIRLRHYAAAKAVYDAAKTVEEKAKLPSSRLMDLVRTHTHELMQDAYDAKMRKR